MHYSIDVPAILGDKVLLLDIAHAKAMRDAKAGDLDFHKPMYEGRLRGYLQDLIADARTGRLEVCNQRGRVSTVDELMADGCDQAVVLNEQREHDIEFTIGSSVYVSIHHLNVWASHNGDSYSLTHNAPWCDERGLMGPRDGNVQSTVAPADDPQGSSAVPAVTRHKLNTRKRELDAEIDLARARAKDAHDYHSVYAELVAMALNREVPFTGTVDETSGIHYTNSNGNVQFLTKAALQKRMKRSDDNGR